MDIELKTAIDNLGAEHKTALTGLKAQLDGLKTDQAKLQSQVDAIDAGLQHRHVAGGETKTLADDVLASEDFQRFAKTCRGRVAIPISDFQKKTTITDTALGFGTPGVVAGDRLAGIIPAAMRTFRLRELLRRPTTERASVEFVKVTTYTQASPQIEGSAKTEATISFDVVDEKVRTIAVWVPVSKQAMSDVAAMRETVNVHLMAGLLDEEDAQVLAGDSTSENLNGLLTQATAFDTSLLSAADGWERADIIARAIQQVETAKHRVTGIVLNPADWWSIVTTKDSQGRYIHGDPGTMTETRLWGRPVTVTDAITAGTFLVGDFTTGAALHMRQDAVIEVSDSHSDYYVKNLLAVRCEERVCLTVYKTAAFVYGSLNTSPAS